MNPRRNLRGTNAVPIRKHEGGYAAQGPDFTIWDEGPVEVLRAARELPMGNFDVPPTTRLLVLRKDFEPTPS